MKKVAFLSFDWDYKIVSEYILEAESLFTILENCEMFARELDCPNVFLSLNGDFVDSDHPEDAKTYGPTSLLVARKGRTTTMRCDGEHVYARYATSTLLPPEVPLDRSLYMVTPLRHNETCVGMLVTEGVPSDTSNGLNAFFLTVLSSSLMAARKSALLQAAKG